MKQADTITPKTIPGREKGRRLRPNRGMALLAIMLMLMMILALSLVGVAGSGSINDISVNGMKSASRRIQNNDSYNLAEAGIYASLDWLQAQTAAPSNTTAFAPSSFYGSTTSNGYAVVTLKLGTNPSGADKSGTFAVRFYPYSQNSTNDSKQFLIESVGTYNGNQIILRITAVQDTFAKYAYFIDTAPADNSWWVAGSTKFNGPVQINANVNPGDTPRTVNILWKNNGTTAADGTNPNQIFKYNGDGAFSIAANRVNWAVNSVGNWSDPSSTNDYKNIAIAGQPSIRLNVSQVPLPTSSTKQQEAARGTVSASTMSAAANGVYLPANGGIYIKGDVNNMDFAGAGGTGAYNTGGTGKITQTITVYQTDTTLNKEVRWTVTVDPVANTTTLQKALATINTTSFSNSGSPTVVSGTTNKVVYSEGNIGKQGSPKTGGISGDIANSYAPGGVFSNYNRWTVATDPNKDMNIDNSITYEADSFVGVAITGQATQITGTLGLVSRHVAVTTQTSSVIGNASGTILKGALNIQATIVAYDTFDVDDFINRNYTGSVITGQTINMLGGYIAKNNGQFGTIFADGTQRSGFTRNLNYDQRVATSPPPAFPTTANRYVLTSLQRVTSTLQ